MYIFSSIFLLFSNDGCNFLARGTMRGMCTKRQNTSSGNCAWVCRFFCQHGYLRSWHTRGACAGTGGILNHRLRLRLGKHWLADSTKHFLFFLLEAIFLTLFLWQKFCSVRWQYTAFLFSATLPSFVFFGFGGRIVLMTKHRCTSGL